MLGSAVVRFPLARDGVEPDVEDTGTVRAEQHGVGGERPVGEAGQVKGGQRGERADREPLQRVTGERPVPGHRLPQRGSLDVLADHVRAVVEPADLQQSGGVRPGRALGGVQLVRDPLPHPGVGGLRLGGEQADDADGVVVGKMSQVDGVFWIRVEPADQDVHADTFGILRE
ncbi:hypothetical protein GCM10018952_10720 [Streptosporangium vulgare]